LAENISIKNTMKITVAAITYAGRPIAQRISHPPIPTGPSLDRTLAAIPSFISYPFGAAHDILKLDIG
jgi:hypothetical protein